MARGRRGLAETGKRLVVFLYLTAGGNLLRLGGAGAGREQGKVAPAAIAVHLSNVQGLRLVWACRPQAYAKEAR